MKEMKNIIAESSPDSYREQRAESWTCPGPAVCNRGLQRVWTAFATPVSHFLFSSVKKINKKGNKEYPIFNNQYSITNIQNIPVRCTSAFHWESSATNITGALHLGYQTAGNFICGIAAAPQNICSIEYRPPRLKVHSTEILKENNEPPVSLYAAEGIIYLLAANPDGAWSSVRVGSHTERSTLNADPVKYVIHFTGADRSHDAVRFANAATTADLSVPIAIGTRPDNVKKENKEYPIFNTQYSITNIQNIPVRCTSAFHWESSATNITGALHLGYQTAGNFICGIAAAPQNICSNEYRPSGLKVHSTEILKENNEPPVSLYAAEGIIYLLAANPDGAWSSVRVGSHTERSTLNADPVKYVIHFTGADRSHDAVRFANAATTADLSVPIAIGTRPDNVKKENKEYRIRNVKSGSWKTEDGKLWYNTAMAAVTLNADNVGQTQMPEAKRIERNSMRHDTLLWPQRQETTPGRVETAPGMRKMAHGRVKMAPGLGKMIHGRVKTAPGIEKMANGWVETTPGRVKHAPGRVETTPGPLPAPHCTTSRCAVTAPYRVERPERPEKVLNIEYRISNIEHRITNNESGSRNPEVGSPKREARCCNLTSNDIHTTFLSPSPFGEGRGEAVFSPLLPRGGFNSGVCPGAAAITIYSLISSPWGASFFAGAKRIAVPNRLARKSDLPVINQRALHRSSFVPLNKGDESRRVGTEEVSETSGDNRTRGFKQERRYAVT